MKPVCAITGKGKDCIIEHYCFPISSTILFLTSGYTMPCCPLQEVRQYATRHTRVFYRAGVNFFRSFILELLVGQLYDSEPDVAEEALDVLDEACQDDVSQCVW